VVAPQSSPRAVTRRDAPENALDKIW